MSKGKGRGHATHFWNYGTLSLYRERFEIKTSNLASRLTIRDTNDKNVKIRSMGVGKGSWRTFEILDPSISREWFELETSNFACRLIAGGTDDKKWKIRSKGSGMGHVTYFWNFGTPPYLGNGLREKLQIWHVDWPPGALTIKMKKLGQRGREGVTWPTFGILGPPPYLGNGSVSYTHLTLPTNREV